MDNHRRIAVVALLTVSFGCAVRAQTPASKFELPKNSPRILRKLQTHLDQGENVIVEFDSSFAKGEGDKEVVTMTLEEGQWKITGYSIH